MSATLPVVLGASALAAGLGAAFWGLRRARRLAAELAVLRAEAEELRSAADQKTREVRALHDLTSRIAGPASRAEPTLAALVSIVARAVEADLVAVLLLDAAAGELAVQPGAFGLEGPDRLYRIPLSEDLSSSVRVFKTGRAFLSGDAQEDPLVIARYARLWGIHSLMVLPISLEGRIVGVLRVGSFRRDHFKSEHLDLLGVISDEAAVILETAMLNKRLGETMEQLRAADRMKDEFVSMVSHEFKTPLTTILGFTTLMLEGRAGPLAQGQVRVLGLVKGATLRLATMVTELLDLARLEGGQRLALLPLPLAELLAASVEAHRPRAEEGGRTLVCDIPVGLPEALGDPKWLRLVVDNLLSNAIKFTKPGGRVRLLAEDKGEALMVRVEDDGVGLAPDELVRVFEKFYRAPNASALGVPGTGLGLSIAAEIVARHGGRIWCESEPGRGARFSFLVPSARVASAGEARL